MANKKDRLFVQFKRFASESEMLHNSDEKNKECNVGIPNNGRMLHAKWTFDDSGDSYEYGANLGKVEKSDESRVALGVMKSKPIVGQSERIDNGALIVLGQRDRQSKLTNAETRRNFMDDVAKIAKA